MLQSLLAALFAVLASLAVQAQRPVQPVHDPLIPATSSAVGATVTMPSGPTQSGTSARLDFGITPDDFGNPNACPTITPLTTQYARSLGIVFGSAVQFPGRTLPAVAIRTDGACPPNPCRSVGVPAFTTDWWCQFVAAGSSAGVGSFAAELCFVDAPGDPLVDVEGYDASGNLIATGRTVAGSPRQTVSITAPGPSARLTFVRVVASRDPGGLSVDQLDFPPPTRLCRQAEATLIPDPFGNNAPDSIFPVPSNQVPSIGNRQFRIGIDEPAGRCSLQPDAATALLLAIGRQDLLLPDWGCQPGTPGTLQVDLLGVLLMIPGPRWSGPGLPAVFQLPIPINPALCETNIGTQGMFIDVTGRRTLTERLLLQLGSTPLFNDTCDRATLIVDGVTIGTNIGATNGATPTSCGNLGSDVWFVYRPTCDGDATISTCIARGGRADFDPIIAVFDGDCGSLRLLACNADACGTDAEVQLPVIGGATYRIAIGGTGGAQGNFALAVACAEPSNDEPTGAIPVGDGLTPGSNAHGTTSPVTGSCGPFRSDVWYAYTASCTGTTTLSMCPTHGGGATFDAMLATFKDAGGSLVELACNDDWCGVAPQLTFPTVQGATYLVAVGGYQGARGQFTLAVTCQ